MQLNLERKNVMEPRANVWVRVNVFLWFFNELVFIIMRKYQLHNGVSEVKDYRDYRRRTHGVIGASDCTLPFYPLHPSTPNFSSIDSYTPFESNLKTHSLVQVFLGIMAHALLIRHDSCWFMRWNDITLYCITLLHYSGFFSIVSTWVSRVALNSASGFKFCLFLFMSSFLNHVF